MPCADLPTRSSLCRFRVQHARDARALALMRTLWVALGLARMPLSRALPRVVRLLLQVAWTPRAVLLVRAGRLLWVASQSGRMRLALERMLRVQVWNTALRLRPARLSASPLVLHLAMLPAPLPGQVPPCRFPQGRSSPLSSRRRRKSSSRAMGLPSARRRSPRCSCRGAAAHSSAMSLSSRSTPCTPTPAASTPSAACTPSASSWSCPTRRSGGQKESVNDGRCRLPAKTLVTSFT